MQWIQPKGQQLHIELTSACQASCPACSRVYDYTSHLNNRKLHSSWDMPKLKATFTTELLSNVTEVLLCGNYGDPLAFEELDQFINYILNTNPRIRFIIHTNGGLGSIELWQKIAVLLAKGQHQVKISIDGLEDTNHLYRRGVSWSKVMENMSSFIKAGGKPYWKFIRFDHNAHQEQEAQTLSQSLGFYRFEVRAPYGESSGYTEALPASQLPSNLQESFNTLSDKEITEAVFTGLNEEEIDCKVVANPSLYFDHDQRVWPCCWLAQDGDHRTRTKKRELFFRRIYDRGISKKFNNLNHHSLHEILSHPFFQDILPKSWSSESVANKQCFSTCLSTCPRKN